MVNQSVYDPERQDASGGFRSGERGREENGIDGPGGARAAPDGGDKTPETETKNE